jgi:hypothetical protein
MALRRRAILIISFVLIVSITLLSVTIYKEKNKFTVPAIENISTIKIVPAKTGGGTREELSFDLSKKEHLDMVNNMLEWLGSAQTISHGKGDMIYHGGTPTYLIIELKDGTTVQIQSAVDSITTEIPNGIMVSSQSVAGQVTLYISNVKKPVRELSPELKDFIDNGWKGFFNYKQ